MSNLVKVKRKPTSPYTGTKRAPKELIAYGKKYGRPPSKVKTSPAFEKINEIYKKHKDKLTLGEIYPLIKHLDNRITRANFYNYYRTRQKQQIEKALAKKQGKKRAVNEYHINKGRKSPVYFAKHFLGVELHRKQKQWLENSCNNSQNILVPANQFGKTFVTAIKHIYLAYYKIGLPEGFGSSALIMDDPRIEYQTLNLSPILKQARKCYKYILDLVAGRHMIMIEDCIAVNESIIQEFVLKPKAVPMANSLSNCPIQFKNGSKVWVASTGQDQASGLAGEQFCYISYDECALSHHLEEELGGRIQSRLITYGGNLDLIGTPDHKSPSRGYYQKIVRAGLKGEDGWYCQTGKLDDNKFVPKENRDKIKKAIKNVDPRIYSQVIMGRFVEGTSKTFLPYTLKRFFNEELEMQEPIAGHKYVIAADWAMAEDYTVMCVMDHTRAPYTIVHWLRYRGNEKSPEEQYTDLLDLKHRYNDADVIMDTSGLGGKIIEQELKDIGAYGYNFGPGRKAGFIQNMKSYFYNGEKMIQSPYIQDLDEELSIYEIEDKKLRQDGVMALGLCLYWIENEKDSFDYSSLKLDFVFT